MRLMNQKELKEIGLDISEYLASQFEGMLGDKDALVCVINNERTMGEGYLVGIATKDERGYKPTFYVIQDHNYKNAEKIVSDANEILFKRTPKETFLIVLSTMRN